MLRSELIIAKNLPKEYEEKMISVKEIIIVEGNYDKIKLSAYIDGVIFVTGGFSIMQDEERVNGLIELVKQNGCVIFTDSDSAGFRIRNFLKQKLPADKIKHAFIPEIEGKERRKSHPGAEGIMGVEGMTKEVIITALKDAGCLIDEEGRKKSVSSITKQDLYFLQLTGRENSKQLRTELLRCLGLPLKMSSNMMCDVLSRMMSFEELKTTVEQIKKDLA